MGAISRSPVLVCTFSRKVTITTSQLLHLGLCIDHQSDGQSDRQREVNKYNFALISDKFSMTVLYGILIAVCAQSFGLLPFFDWAIKLENDRVPTYWHIFSCCSLYHIFVWPFVCFWFYGRVYERYVRLCATAADACLSMPRMSRMSRMSRMWRMSSLSLLSLPAAIAAAALTAALLCATSSSRSMLPVTWLERKTQTES